MPDGDGACWCRRMGQDMANPSKAKGDNAERDAVAYLLDVCPDLCRPKAKRMLGAGRAEDVGDLYVFVDTAVQVRAFKAEYLGSAVRSSARDSVVQAGHGDMEFALGLVPFPRARRGTVKWLACVEPDAWPGGPGSVPITPVEFALVSKALAWVRDDEGPHGFMAYPRRERVARLSGGKTRPVLIAPFEAWLAAYRTARTRPGTVLMTVDDPPSTIKRPGRDAYLSNTG